MTGPLHGVLEVDRDEARFGAANLLGQAELTDLLVRQFLGIKNSDRHIEQLRAVQFLRRDDRFYPVRNLVAERGASG
jgi:hypothetical protein